MVAHDVVGEVLFVEAVRFNCSSGKARICTVSVALVEKEDGDKALILTGGVTGCESLVVRGYGAADLQRLMTRGWWACAGTRYSWDSLYLHGLEMELVFNHFKLL